MDMRSCFSSILISILFALGRRCLLTELFISPTFLSLRFSSSLAGHSSLSLFPRLQFHKEPSREE